MWAIDVSKLLFVCINIKLICNNTIILYQQVKLEMCRIFSDPKITRTMKENLTDTWLPKIMAHSKTIQKGAVEEILNDMDLTISRGEISEMGK